MSHTLTISDTLQRRGLNSIEQLLEIWHSFDVKLKQRRETVYGEMTD